MVLGPLSLVAVVQGPVHRQSVDQGQRTWTSSIPRNFPTASVFLGTPDKGQRTKDLPFPPEAPFCYCLD